VWVKALAASHAKFLTDVGTLCQRAAEPTVQPLRHRSERCGV